MGRGYCLLCNNFRALIIVSSIVGAGVSTGKNCWIFSLGSLKYSARGGVSSFATMLLEEKVNPKIVAEMMGHSNIKTTLDIYSTVFKAVYVEAADTLNNAFTKISTKGNPQNIKQLRF